MITNTPAFPLRPTGEALPIGRCRPAVSFLRKWIVLGMALCGIFWSGTATAQENLAGRNSSVSSLVARDVRLSVLEQNLPRLNQVVSVHFDGTSLEDALTQISRKSGLHLVYGKEKIAGADAVTLRMDNVTVLEALHGVLKNTPYTLKISAGGHLILADHPTVMTIPEPELRTTTEVLPEHQVSGKVTSDEGDPLPGVNILIKGTDMGTATDFDGRYTLNARTPNDTLVFRFIGFQNQEVPIAGRSTINIVMKSDQLALDEVVVIGYGEVRRRDLTGSVASVVPDKLERMPISNVAEGLQGRIAGVQIQQTTGVPGSVPVIRVRGGNSIQGGNNPLFVVDGIIGAYGPTEINPADIASIEVLKDASATAIYGARGANGVIIITTRRGQTGAPRVDVNSYYGFQTLIDRLEYIDGPQAAEVLNARADYLGIDRPFANPANVQTYDWAGAILRDAPPQFNQFISVGGGTESIQYRVSGEYFSQDGIIVNSNYERINLRSNFDINVAKWAKVGVNLGLSRTDRAQIDQPNNEQNPFYQAYHTARSTPIYNADGSFNYNISPTDPNATFSNPVEQITRETHNQLYRTANLQAYVDLQPAKGLTYRLNTAYSNSDGQNQDYIPSTTFRGLPIGGDGNQSWSNSSTWLVENTLRYQTDIGQHSIGLLGGLTAQRSDNESLSAGNSQFLSDLFLYYNLSAGSTEQRNVGSGYGGNRLLSVPARFTYDYADRYLFTFNARYDGSSRFGKNNQWAFFPSGAFGWVISDESFMRGLRAFDLLKLRASYGLTGSEAIGSYQTLALFGTGIAAAGDDQEVVFFRQLRLPNPNLKWETTAQADIGMEASFMNGRLDLNFDWYDKKTTDLLLNRSIPALTGFTTVTDNIGSLRNRGVEFSMNYAPIIEQNLGLDFEFNIGANRNTVLDLGEVDSLIIQGGIGNTKETRDALILKEGLPVGSFRVYKTNGIYQNQAEIDGSPHVSGARPGFQWLVDANNDGKISDLDRVIVGDAEPDFTFGLNTNFRFQNWNLAVFLQGNYGGQTYNINRFVNREGLKEFYEGYWRGEGTSSRFEAPGAASYLTEDLVEDASYLRLRTVTLAYNLPQAMMQKLRVQNLRLYFTGQNLLTLTGYSGNNPEANNYGGNNTVLGSDFGGYPLSRIYTFGVNLTL